MTQHTDDVAGRLDTTGSGADAGSGVAEGTVPDELAFDVADLPGGALGALEAVLMVADEPVSAVQLATVLALPTIEVERLLTELVGDYRGDNILFDPDGSVVLLDFQLIGSGTGAYDLAYMITQSVDADVAASHERALFNRWLDGLGAAGITYDADQAWLDYRKAALFCLVYPVVASRGMDLSDKRQHDLIDAMNTRYARAARDLQLAELL